MTSRTSQNDIELVRRVGDGDGGAMEVLRARHQGAVFDFALRMTGSVATAREIAESVFADVAGGLSDLGEDVSFRAWVFTEANRRIISRLPLDHDLASALDSDVSVVVDLRDVVTQPGERLVERVWDAALSLDRQTQAVIDLHLRQGLDPSELAAILGVPPAAAADVVERMKRTAAETLATHLLRTESPVACPELASTEGAAAARVHVAGCEVCSARRATLYSPLQILGALRVVPPTAANGAVATAPVVAPAPAGRRRRLATPLGVLSIVAGALAIVAIGVLTYDRILEPLGIVPVRTAAVSATPSTTVAPTSATIPVVAAAGAAQTLEDEAVDIEVLGDDGSRASADIEVIEPPEHGSVVVIGSVVRYTPEPDYNGADRFVYAVTPQSGRRSEATVTLSVIPVDDVLALIPGATVAVVEDEPMVIDLRRLVDEVDGDELVVVGFDETTAEGSSVSEGLTYTPVENFNGTDLFIVTVTDGTTELVVPVVLAVAAVNDTPSGPTLNRATTDEDVDLDIDVLAGWSDVDGDEIMAIEETGRSDKGGLVVVRGRVATYMPPENFFGDDTFNYRITDGDAVAFGSVAVSITAVADPPVITRASFGIDETAKVGTVVGSVRATDAEGDAVSFSLRGSQSVVSLSGAGRVELVKRVDHESTPTVRIAAVAIDATGARTNFNIVITVRDVNEAPSGRDQQLLVPPWAAKGTKIGKVAVSDPEGDALGFSVVAGDRGDVLSVDADSGLVRTLKRADPTLFPITLSVEATDPSGLSTVVLVVVRLDDFKAPDISSIDVKPKVVWEQQSPGVACPSHPNKSIVTAEVDDRSGVASASLSWSAVFDGVPLAGSTRMVIDGTTATGSFTFGADLVTPGGKSVVTVRIVAVDNAGNTATSGSFTITVRSCAG